MDMTGDVEHGAVERRTVATQHGTVSVVDVGRGPVLLFVHGVFTGAFLWRKAIDRLCSQRRCIAIDLPTHGQSGATPDQDLSLSALAELLEEACVELALEQVDLVGNDTGGALSQIFAARHPERIRTLTLTNTDAHDNLPPQAFKDSHELALRGELAAVLMYLGGNPQHALGVPGLGMGFEHPQALDEREFHTWLGVYADPERARAGERFAASSRVEDLLAAEEDLARLRAPTLIVWGTGDIFFEVDWAYWLRDHIAGASEVVEVAGAKLCFPYERVEEFVGPLRRFLDEHSPLSQTTTAGAALQTDGAPR
jgi:pimeloyl-ACP methyl ester carboxylesterase